MEFINIGRLRTDLRSGPLPSLDVAKYLAAQGALGALVFVPGQARVGFSWEYVSLPCLALAGVYYCYRSNGGAQGLRLAERYLAIGWVIGLRVGLVAGTTIATVLVMSGVIAGAPWPSDAHLRTASHVATHSLIALVYWRIGVHLRDVGRDTGPRQDGAAPIEAAR